MNFKESFPLLGNSFPTELRLIYLIAAATKIEENEAEMEILLDDAGGSGGIPTSSAITAIGAGILACFIIAACCILWCKK